VSALSDGAPTNWRWPPPLVQRQAGTSTRQTQTRLNLCHASRRPWVVRLAQNAHLSQEAELVEFLPVLNGGSDTCETASMGTRRPPSGGDSVPLGDLVFDGHHEVSECTMGRLHRGGIDTNADDRTARHMADEGRVEQLRKESPVPAGQDLFVVPAYQGLVVLQPHPYMLPDTAAAGKQPVP